jgi:hypothetical protein
MTDSKPEKQNIASWIRHLENQIENRNSEVALLRRELEEKVAANRELMQTLERDSIHISETTTALEAATHVINRQEEKIVDLDQTIAAQQSQLETVRRIEPALRKECQELESRIQSLEKELLVESARQAPLRKKIALAGVIGLLLGAAPLAARMALQPRESAHPIISAEKTSPSKTEGPTGRQELRAAPLAPQEAEGTITKSALSMPAEQEATPTFSNWSDAMSELRRAAFDVDATTPFDRSPEYAENAIPTVITRAQFRDIVSTSLASALPSRTADGILLYEFEGEDIDAALFEQQARDANLPVAPLCNPWNKDPAFFRRLTILVGNSAAGINCLRQLMTSQWFKNHWEEIAVITLTGTPRHALSYFGEKKFFNYQEWDPNWLTRITTAVEGEKTGTAEQRAIRLARLARILTKSSDVRVQVPVRTDGKNGLLNFGNLAVVPAEISIGPLKVSRISLQTGLPFGRLVSQPITPGARAVIINGAEQTLSIENNAR